MAKKKIRFSFVIPNGPHAGYTGGSWLVWTHKQDTYIAENELGRKWKTSLHGDVAWRHAVTAEHAGSADSVLPPGHDRALWRFTPPPFVDGQRLAFVIGVSRGAMLPRTGTAPWAKHIEVQDRWDQVTFAGVHMTEPGIDLRVHDDVVGGPLSLSSGHRVWVTTRTEAVDGVPEQGIVGSMVKPMTPETDGVLAPTLMLLGLRLG